MPVWAACHAWSGTPVWDACLGRLSELPVMPVCHACLGRLSELSVMPVWDACLGRLSCLSGTPVMSQRLVVQTYPDECAQTKRGLKQNNFIFLICASTMCNADTVYAECDLWRQNKDSYILR